MKYCLVVSLVIALHSLSASAQTVRSWRVKAGDDIAQAYSTNGFYRFPQFAPATLYYNTGAANAGEHFNYNILSANMQFIGSKGDTLELGGKDNLDSVVVGATTYLYNNGFYEVVAMADSIRLLKKTVIKTETENIGAYGMPNSTASITNMRSFTTNTSVYNLTLNQDVVVTETTSWFFADKTGIPVKATKANFLKLISPAKQPKTEAWLKQNKTNFDREPDLKKLMAALDE